LTTFIAAIFILPLAFAQHEGMNMPDATKDQKKEQKTEPQKNDQEMRSMQMGDQSHMQMDMDMKSDSLIQQILHHGASGTSAQPDSTPIPMLMTMKGGWALMFHANAFVSFEQQSGARGSDKVFSTNWFMPMAQRELGPGTLTLRFMASLEPATVSRPNSPLLFQQGEIAIGRLIVDVQHPHDFIMELAALYYVKIGKKNLVSFYFAPMGDPAMGPSAYPHRASASENPVAALGHHLQDSTHIADDVITVGFTHRAVRVEASAFHGREPDENRWDLDSGKIDSWSTRFTVNPARNWSAQYSIGHLTSPEDLHPAEDMRRMTASVMYNRPLAHGNWASTILWGRNTVLPKNEIFNSYLAESTLRFAEKNYVWTRIENVDRTNELLLGKVVEPPGFDEKFLARIQAYTLGYDHDFDLIPHLATAIGGQFTWYGTPDLLKTVYGQHPVGGMLMLRFRPFGKER
jgi:hypothetical protein